MNWRDSIQQDVNHAIGATIRFPNARNAMAVAEDSSDPENNKA
jgi:hypothetical protein